jgi:6-pyruvoyltetrahydropterin/6-carboxytetrahydropterin synthase
MHSTDNIQKNAHQHTFTFALSIEANQKDGLTPFFEIDHTIRSYLSQYKGEYLNSMPQFRGIYPTIEWIGEVIFEHLYLISKERGWNFLQLEISENPLEIYIISDRILSASKYYDDNQKGLDNILKYSSKYVRILRKIKEEA